MPYPSLETFEVANNNNNNNNSLISLFMCSSNSMLGKEIVQQCSSCSVSQRCSAPYSRSLEVGHLSSTMSPNHFSRSQHSLHIMTFFFLACDAAASSFLFWSLSGLALFPPAMCNGRCFSGRPNVLREACLPISLLDRIFAWLRKGSTFGAHFRIRVALLCHFWLIFRALGALWQRWGPTFSSQKRFGPPKAPKWAFPPK